MMGASQEFTQGMVTMGSAIAYTFTMAAFLRIALRKTRVTWHIITAVCALAMCAVYLITGTQLLFKLGTPLLLYFVLFLIALGVCLFFAKKRQTQQV
jgi:peptidoglycan/LPS O-acetylase OafA/YrhL